MTSSREPGGLLETLIDSLPTGVVVVDSDGTVRHVNDAACDLIPVDRRPHDLAGSPHDRVVAAVAAAERSGESADRLRSIAADREPREGERFDLTGDPARTIAVSYAPVALPDGPGDVWLYRDVTDRAVVERRLRAVHDLAERLLFAASQQEIAEHTLETVATEFSMPVSAVWAHDRATDRLEVIAATDEATDLFDGVPDFERGEGLAWTTFEDGAIRLYDDLSSVDGRYNPDTPARSELIVPLGDRGVLIAGSTDPGAFDESDVEVFGVLAKLVTAAARRVDERQNIELLKQVFARILRHNTRNNLTVIEGFAEEIADVAGPAATDYAGRIHDAAVDLERTVERASAVQTVVENPGNCGTLEIGGIVRRAAADVADRYPEATVRVETPDRPLEVSAHVAVAAAVGNLVENGIVHHDGDPTVDVRVVPDDRRQVRVVVADDGPGIDDDEVTVLDERRETPLEHGSGAGL